ncbi:MAG TPA: hypothetical protein VL049_07005, partial [Candidatus Dormibacteraeota bacterium]|nr:hypothetical protein [Candidatus Dormibacteraeota bacterium]
AAAVALATLVVAVAARAQDSLVCGAPTSRALAAGATHSYRLSQTPGSSVVIQTSDVGGTLGLIRIRVSGPGGEIVNTCQGVAQFTAVPGPLELQVSQCSGRSDGQYTVSLNVVSDDGGNCGRPLSCGATPDGIGFALAGEVDSFLLSLNEGQAATLRLNYTDSPGAPSLRLFGPDGAEIALDGRCAGQITVDSQRPGIYTALVSACGRPVQLPYRIEFSDESCPSGPVITTFTVANAANDTLQPIGSDAAGRPVFNHSFGQGFSLVLEARAGANRHNPGVYPAPYFEGEDLQPPDMQMILSRPLGDGSAVICDTFPPDLGGVPATVPFRFEDSAPALDIIHDMGCRFLDGTGQLVARQSSLEACTRSDEGFGFGFVDRASRIQFCGLIATAWSFPLGDTIVGARIKDAAEGEFSQPREIVVRIGEPTLPSVTPTPSVKPSTATPSRTRTPARTATPTSTGATPTFSGTCAGDCNGDRQVSIADLIEVLTIVIGDMPISSCPAADADGDGMLTIGDIIAAVNSALNGCH